MYFGLFQIQIFLCDFVNADISFSADSPLLFPPVFCEFKSLWGLAFSLNC